MKILATGISSTSICGVRDAAHVLEGAFRTQGTDTSTLWCELSGAATLREQRRRVSNWLAEVRRESREEQVDAIILHYSVFAYGRRGLPMFVPFVARELAAAEAPVVGFLHEFAYPFGRRGWRGAMQAVSHRLALFSLVRSCSGLAVTTERRAEWMRACRWLPRRPVVFVPVFSNLPPAAEQAGTSTDSFSIGVFGFASPGVDVDLIGDAVSRVDRSDRPLELVLIGAPGEADPAAERWRIAFRARGCLDALRFTGVQPAADLALEIAAVDVMLFPDRAGPDSRRGTLAAALAASKAVLAFTGPEQWDRLVAEGAVIVVPHDSNALAAELTRFAADPSLRAEQETRAMDFYGRLMAPEVAATTVASLVTSAASTPRSSQVEL